MRFLMGRHLVPTKRGLKTISFNASSASLLARTDSGSEVSASGPRVLPLEEIRNLVSTLVKPSSISDNTSGGFGIGVKGTDSFHAV